MNPIMIRYPVMRFSRASIMRTGKSCPIFRHASSTSLLAFCYHCAIIAHENSESIRVFSDNERRHLDQQPPISDIASQLTRFNDPMLAPVPFLSSPRLSSFTPLPPSPGFFFITSPLHSYRNVGKKAKHRSVIRYITLSGSQVLSGVIDVYPPERVRAGGRRDRGGGREADVDHMPPSMFNTLSPGQSSPRLEASPLVFTIPLSPQPLSPSPLCRPSYLTALLAL